MLEAMKPLILFAPGAGAPSTSPWMQAWAERLATLGRVASLDYPYMLAGKKLPDRLPALIAAHKAALTTHKKRARQVVLAGKSMGSRVGCHLANEPDVHVDLLVCFGYPLVSPAGTRRDEVLLALATPVLFVQGDRDPLCPLDVLAEVRAKMVAPSELMVVAGGDHSLEVRGGQAARVASDLAIQARVAAFVHERLGDASA